MKKYKVGQIVWWASEKEKVEITHINRSMNSKIAIWIHSKNSGVWVLYESAIKPIISLHGVLTT